VKGMKKVLAGGRFNKFHIGHEYFLKKAKSFGDHLVVIIANDVHNKKGKISAAERKSNIEKLSIADNVRIGYSDSFVKSVEEERPDIIALGYDQKLPEDTVYFADKKKIKIVRIKKYGNYSSSRML
jgi:FAD synthetase